jgi:ubiquinone/menaquinone biosynthesis C-methylase UbiE
MKKDKIFYERHSNFSGRSVTEYYISPGIYHKFNKIKEEISSYHFKKGIDLGCSGNSLLNFIDKLRHKNCFDLSETSLKQYTKNVSLKRNKREFWHPICGTITNLPYRDRCFDFISCLDVLEHIKDDKSAIKEISRILNKDGILIVTVPHKMGYFSQQDKIIGHYRRYELSELKILFEGQNLKLVKILKIYGRLMRISDIQSKDPEGIESSLTSLRVKYERNKFFRIFWDVFVRIGAYLMEFDTRISPFDKIMNIGLIFKMKES